MALALLEPPSQHQRHGNLQNLAGLDHDAYIDPARGSLFGDAKYRHRNQQRHAHHIQRHRQGGQALRRNLSHEEQHSPRNQHVAPVVLKPRAVVKPRRIHRQQAHRHQDQHRKRQQSIKAAEPRKDFFEN